MFSKFRNFEGFFAISGKRQTKICKSQNIYVLYRMLQISIFKSFRARMPKIWAFEFFKNCFCFLIVDEHQKNLMVVHAVIGARQNVCVRGILSLAVCVYKTLGVGGGLCALDFHQISSFFQILHLLEKLSSKKRVQKL